MVISPRRELWSRALQKVSTNACDASRMLWLCLMTGALKLEDPGLCCMMTRQLQLCSFTMHVKTVHPCCDRQCQGKAPDRPLPCGQDPKQEG